MPSSLAPTAYISSTSAESKAVGVDQATGEYKFIRDTFAGVGIDNYNTPPSQNPDMFELLTNVQPVSTGTLSRRWGSSLLVNTGILNRKIYEYQNDSSGIRKLLYTDVGAVAHSNENGTSSTFLFTPGGNLPRVTVSRDWAYFYDGILADNLKWNSTNGLIKTGITGPTTAITLGAPVAGSISLLQGRKYYGAFKNFITGHVSDLSPVSASTGPLVSQNVPLTFTEAAQTDVDRRLWFATADGGDETTLYLLADTPIATTSITDNITEDVLLVSNIYLETDEFGVQHGVADNSRPPLGVFPTKHKGRIWLVNGQNLFFSKDMDEVTTSTGLITSRYEEAWPAYNTLDIAEGTETIRGLLSDGDTLYVGTERHIRRINGDSPSNFSKPEVAFNNVGLLNQDVWQVVYLEGAPVGSIWLTPDFRLIASDFNVYRNIGTPVQATLNTINPAAVTKCRATFGSIGAYDLYLLAIPTGSNTECDTIIVYQVATKRFFIWKVAGVTFSDLHVNITQAGVTQWLFADVATGKVYFFDTAQVQDLVGGTPANFTTQARTSWMHLGDPSSRKILNELEIIGDPTMLVTIEGASSDADFASPNVVCTNQPLVTSPFGQLKLYLAGKTTKDRFYRFTFTGASTSLTFLDGIGIDVVPINRL